MTLQVAILTRHDKARLVAPALRSLGWHLSEQCSFDTDSLGSFSGERPRFMSPNECAIRKAAIAVELSGVDVGIGSEGSFSAGPYGLGTFNLELLSCVHVDAGWAVTGRFYGPADVQRWTLQCPNELGQALHAVPDGQKLLLQQQHVIHKGLSVAEARLLAEPLLAKGTVELSFDLRAHCCPQRQQHIVLAAQDLVARLKSTCPNCATPGFWPDKALSGLPCGECGAATTLTKLRQASCQRCDYSIDFAVEAANADAQYCLVCNP